MLCWCENEVSEKSKHSSWTVGHVSRWGNLTPPTIIICKETIVFNNNDLGVRLPAYTSYGWLPLLGDGVSILLSQHPLPDFPPYVVRTPHIHGATDYGAPNSSGGLMVVTMVMMVMMAVMMMMRHTDSV